MKISDKAKTLIEVVLEYTQEVVMDAYCSEDDTVLHTLEEIGDKDIEKIEIKGFYRGLGECKDFYDPSGDFYMLYTPSDGILKSYLNGEFVEELNLK